LRRQPTIRLLAALLVSAFTCNAGDTPRYRAGSLAKQEPQSIYAADPHDAWNRIFYLLFTRTVEMRLTEDFNDQGPFVPVAIMGNPSLLVTSRTFERIESGDRAIDPLYPNFFNSKGPESVLADPVFSGLKQALQEACGETTPRPPLHRVLMQADIWSAYDILSQFRESSGQFGDRARELLPLLVQFIRKLALSDEEIAALPRNYLAAQNRLDLPRVFDESSGWREVEWFPDRSHDAMAGYRRAARVFLKPASTPQEFPTEVNDRIGKREDPLPNGIRSLDGAALVTENLLIDRDGRVVRGPITYEVQLRIPVRDQQGNFKSTSVVQYELNRKLLLTDPSSGGLIRISSEEPAYLPASGNDFTFASPQIEGKTLGMPILGTLKRRCESCHFETSVNTFLMIQIPTRPPVPFRELQSADDSHAAYVVKEKMKKPGFKLLNSLQ
jgi:hypothetical protein